MKFKFLNQNRKKKIVLWISIHGRYRSEQWRYKLSAHLDLGPFYLGDIHQPLCVPPRRKAEAEDLIRAGQEGSCPCGGGLMVLGRKGIVVIGSRVSKGDSDEPFWEGMEGISWHKGQLAVMALSDGYVLLCKCMFIGFFKMQIKHLALHLVFWKKACH